MHPARIDVAEPEQLGRGADRRERIAQLVREHRQEFILAAVGLHQLFFNQLAVGDVAEERRNAAVLGRIGAQIDPDAAAIGKLAALFGAARLAAGHHALVHAPGLALEHGREHGPMIAADDLVARDGADAQAFGVHVLHHPVAVEQREAFGDIGEDLAAPVALLAQHRMRTRRAGRGPGALGHVTRQPDVVFGPRARHRRIDTQARGQAARRHQRHHQHGAHALAKRRL